MQTYKFMIAAVISGLLFSGLLSAQENAPDYRAFVDIVYEWTPNGNKIQVGDFIISNIQSVWLDNGSKEMVRVGTSYIRHGKPVRAVLKSKDSDGYWIADKIIVFSGDGLKTAVKQLSVIKRKEYLELSNP